MTINLEKSLDIDAPVQSVFDQWKDIASYPRFMPQLRAVRSAGENQWIWETQNGDWQVAITQVEPQKEISWRVSAPDNHTSTATVRFTELDGGRTNVLFATHHPNGLGLHHTVISMSAEMEQSLFKFAKLLSGEAQSEDEEQVEDGQEDKQNKQATLTQSFEQSSSEQNAGQQPEPQPAEENVPSIEEGLTDIVASTQNLQRTLTDATQAWTTSMTQAFESFANLMWTPLKGFGLNADQSSAHTWTPQLDVQRRDGMLLVSSELPGYAPDDVHVEIRDGKLLVSGERHAYSEANGGSHDEELERFQQSMFLNLPVDAQHVEAELTPAGQLRIALPIKPENRFNNALR